MATPTPNIIRIAQCHDNRGLTQTQALREANTRRLILAPNTEFDRRLVKTGIWNGEWEIYPAWSGTLGAYAGAGKKPGQFIQYKDSETGITYTFEVPVEARNEKNAILAINHGFTADGKPLIAHREDGKDKIFIEIADPSQIKILEGFPASNDWYPANNEFGIPLGKAVSSDNQDVHYMYRINDSYDNQDARYLYRINGSYVGLAARGGIIIDSNYRRGVILEGWPSARLGVLAEKTGLQPLFEPIQQLKSER